MKLAFSVCVAFLAVVLLQAEDGMGPPSLAADTRVSNGRPAAPGEFPYMTYIEASNGSGEDTRVCCGSLITRAAVLTEAWCIYNRTNYKVRLGSIYHTGNDTNAWTVDSIWALMHPKYDDQIRDNDIAIIYLPRLAPLNEFIQPVHLPCSPVNDTYIGCQGIVSGWGETHQDSGISDVLHWAEVLVIPNAICKQFAPSHVVADRQLCAGSFGTTVWNYDDGAPLVLNNRGRYIQIGLFSRYTSREYNTSHPIIYTRVTSYIDWITLNTESECSEE